MFVCLPSSGTTRTVQTAPESSVSPGPASRPRVSGPTQPCSKCRACPHHTTCPRTRVSDVSGVQQTTQMSDGARPKVAGAEVARFQPCLPLSDYLFLSSPSQTELLGLPDTQQNHELFPAPPPCLHHLFYREHVFPLISKYDILQGHQNAPSPHILYLQGVL